MTVGQTMVETGEKSLSDGKFDLIDLDNQSKLWHASRFPKATHDIFIATGVIGNHCAYALQGRNLFQGHDFPPATVLIVSLLADMTLVFWALIRRPNYFPASTSLLTRVFSS